MAHYNKSTAQNNSGNGRSFSGNRSRNNSFRNNRSGGGNRSRGKWNNNSRGGRRFSKGSNSPQLNRSHYINDLQHEVEKDKSDYKGKKYTDFKFDYGLNKNLESKGFETTTEIQEKTIPMILGGKDVLGISATGSGKTGAFLIPMIQKLLTNDSDRLLVVAPTRELAQQIMKEAVSFIRGTHLQTALIIGGESMHRQISQLRRGGHIVVGTPGRLNDLIKRNELQPNKYNNIVIDEVDRMLDMGFIEDIRFIFSKISQERQALFFSATHNNTVEKIVSSFTNSFEVVKLANNKPSKNVIQKVIDYSHPDEKIDLLQEILKTEEVVKTIVFVDTKRYADKVDKILYQNKFKVAVIHGDKRQNVRKRVIEKFKYSKVDILVATNVAARGIDIDDITHVINLDEPQSYDEYIHRIGRTGRNGSYGTAYTFLKKSRR